MDCVSCLLMGMCMLCGQNFGGSKVHTVARTGAAAPGRPMTRAEVDTALHSALRHLNTGNSNTISYRRQSKLDPRFGHMGIGKRRGTDIDPYNFSFGLGKRGFQDNSEPEDQLHPYHDAQNIESDTSLNFARHNPSFSNTPNNFANKLSLQRGSNPFPDDNSFITNQMNGRVNYISKYNDFLDEEIMKLQLRRQKQQQQQEQQEHNPFFTIDRTQR